MNESLYVVLGAYPAAALATAFVQINLVGAAAILAVALLRIPARRAFGPAQAYHLWLVPPLAAAIALVVHLARKPADPAIFGIDSDLLVLGAAVWSVGAAAVALLFAVSQAKFLRQVRAGLAGPAVVGLISPRIVMPADDAGYTEAERELIRAHEREHVARKDPRGVAFVALWQVLAWFNPAIHLAAALIRLDQELACDAAVVMTRPGCRALYARTLLKTQLAATPLPLGCYWPARGRHPLEVRIEALKRERTELPRTPGGVVVAATVDAIRP